MEKDRENTDEHELVNMARDGDDGAFEDLVRLHRKAVYAFVYRLSGNGDDAAEIVQNTFIKAYRSMGRFRGESSFKTWLYRIAVNTFRNHLRDKARRKHLSIDEKVLPSGEDVFATVSKRQERGMVQKAMNDLPPRQREALILRINEEYRFSEVADIMKCSVGAAKANYHQAVQKLKAIIGGWENDV